MMGLWLPRGSCVAAVVLLLMALSPPVALVRDPRPRYLEQLKAECHYLKGKESVRSVTRFIYNQEEFAQFDSDIGKFRAVTELGQPIAEDLNSQKDVLENYRASVDRCRNNYRLVDWFLLNLKAEPQVSVYPTKTQPLEHHNLLVCSASRFYPSHIEVRWFRNGQEEKDGVISTGLIQNGDWTYQILVMLEMVPQSGEVYTCQVEHPSLASPVTVEWTAQSTSTQNRVWSGVIFVLGLLLPVVQCIYFRTREVRSPAGPNRLHSISGEGRGFLRLEMRYQENL
ncbi:H-2 class II histocompatibility antigen, E-D beta chain-like isoform X1 [Cricetulus griseus]|uniref:H-2 class II histocompatibility antigen, E-D beta chain-like isoform X1 n=1 Tax=Cricetulus griseus TaxID=10029 RepID=UPI0015C3564B|nr:H-2 class II histocompatibility antigen, E-D beta chain-like isoform X1 [Cricetulus griseus]